MALLRMWCFSSTSLALVYDVTTSALALELSFGREL